MDIFKKFYNYVKDKFTKNDDMSLEEFINRYSDDKEFLDYLDFVKFSLNEISNVMEQINFEYDEYYNFALIKRMITYIVDNHEKYFHYSSFIVLLLKNFNDLLLKKDNLTIIKKNMKNLISSYMKKKTFSMLKSLIVIQNTTMR